MNPRPGAHAPQAGGRIQVDFYFDLICPWCMIGKRQLERAIDLIAADYPRVDVDVHWKSLPLLPGMPREGMSYPSFYLRRLGSVEAVEARRRQVREAGSACGIDFDFERIEWMPNTIAAHLLVDQAGKVGGSMLQSQLIDRLFAAYFQQGLPIGDVQALADIGASYGMAREECLERMASPEYKVSLDLWQIEATSVGISGVPGFVFGDRMSLSGALPPQVLAKSLLDALAL